MRDLLRKSLKFCVVAMIVAWSMATPAHAMPQNAASDSGSIQGTVCDADHRPLAGAVVTIDGAGQTRTAITNAQGIFRISALSTGTYQLTATAAGWRDGKQGPIPVNGDSHVPTVTFYLEPDSANAAKKVPAQEVAFSEEPNFTVAGVTDPTNLGGHGSDVAVSTKESLARATISLNHANVEEEKKRVAALREQPDSAELHELQGDIAESEGRPLEAVREYERATTMDGSEANYFAWGAELLLHRAFEPAGEVFAKGSKLYPKSSRLMIGLGVALFSLGSTEDAARQLAVACDVDPNDPTPYLFLGKMQAAEKIEPPGWTEKLARFANSAPGNAWAHYYYAVALTKGTNEQRDSPKIEAALQTAIAIDPKFGDAYLQLGIWHTQQKNYSKAIKEYQIALNNGAAPDETHYRLAQAYRLSGQGDKVQDEIRLTILTSKERMAKSEEERRAIPQFVYELRGSGVN
jgi:tetratricopeptide (TPR) repeat protein